MFDFEIRELAENEIPASLDLVRATFGLPEDPRRTHAPQTRYGAVASDGELVGTVTALHRCQWWGGRLVPTADVVEVAVAPAARGRGIARGLLRALLTGAREHGAAVSTLFPTVSSLYRAAGWATVGMRRQVELPTARLRGRRPPTDLAVRAGHEADRTAAGRLYTEMARKRNGMQARDAPPFGPVGFLGDDIDDLVIVEADGQMVGYATWSRGVGHGAGAVVNVVDLVARTSEAAIELIAVLSGWGTVVPAVRIRSLLSGVISEQLPLEGATQNRVDPLMHRFIDAAAAVAARGWPTQLRVATGFRLMDELAPWNSGHWKLEVADGQGRLERSECGPGPELDVRGLALLTCGAASPGMLIGAGLASCRSEAELAALACLAATPPPESLDFF